MINKKKARVFHGLRNFGTQAGLFATKLRDNDITAIAVVKPDQYKRIVDIELLHGGNFLQKCFKHFWNKVRLVFWFLKYNTFHFYFGQSMGVNNWDLPFYGLFGKKVIMEYLGNDIRNYNFLVERYELPNDHRFKIQQQSHDRKISKILERDGKYIDYKLCCLPTQMELAKHFSYKIDEILPLALDLSKIKYSPLEIESKRSVRILHAPTSRGFKGTKYIIKSIDDLKSSGYSIDLYIAEGISHKELLDEYRKCDIFIDQISVGWFGTAALEAMAVGRPTCAFVDDLYFQYIDYSDEIPVINITKDNVRDVIKELISNKMELQNIGLKSRKFVEKYHDIEVVTKKLIDIYRALWDKK